MDIVEYEFSSFSFRSHALRWGWRLKFSCYQVRVDLALKSFILQECSFVYENWHGRQQHHQFYRNFHHSDVMWKTAWMWYWAQAVDNVSTCWQKYWSSKFIFNTFFFSCDIFMTFFFSQISWNKWKCFWQTEVDSVDRSVIITKT